MKIRFTICSFLMVSIFATGLFGQALNTMTITSPASIAGEYPIAVASYGDQSGTAFSGPLVLGDDGDTTDSNGDGNPGTITDGCEAFTNAGELAGNIALVDRGECFFGTKSENAENAGAIAMVLCNNDAANPNTLVIPGPGPNGEGEGTSIPTVSITYNDCQLIKMALDNGPVTATFDYVEPPCATPNYGPEVIWGDQPGEGDFDGGLNGWTIMNEDSEGDGWVWVDPADNYSIFGSQIGSITECNGYVHLDAWNLGNSNQSICDPCNGSVISPIIDLSGLNIEGLYVEFDQMFIQFFARTFVIASPDGGVTWPDTFPVNQLTIVNSFESSRTVRVALPGYEDASSIRLQFYKSQLGTLPGYYYWGIDDVRLINESSVDMRANFNFFATAPSYRTPLSQASFIPFLIDIFNAGNLTATDVEVEVEIFKEDGSLAFQAVNEYPDIEPWTSFENKAFDETYTPDEIGFYTGRYIAKASGDENGANDTIPFFFEVTENILSPLPAESEFASPPVFQPITSGSTWAPGSSSFTLNYAAGHIFYIPNGDEFALTNVRFGVADDASRNGTVNVWLYAWLRQDMDDSGSFEINSDNTLLVGTSVGGGQIINPAFGSQRIIDVEMASADLATGEALLDNSGEPVPLELRDDQLYVMVFATNSNNNTQIGLLGFDSDSPNIQTRNWNVNAANLALDSVGSNRLTGTVMAQTSSGSFDEIDNLNFTGGTWGINELYVEYTIVPLADVGTEDLNSSQNITVYPNPASEWAYVELALDQVSDVSIEIVNIEGKLIQRMLVPGVVNDRVRLDLHDLETGIYQVNVRTKEGFTTKRLIVTH